MPQIDKEPYEEKIKRMWRSAHYSGQLDMTDFFSQEDYNRVIQDPSFLFFLNRGNFGDYKDIDGSFISDIFLCLATGMRDMTLEEMAALPDREIKQIGREVEAFMRKHPVNYDEEDSPNFIYWRDAMQEAAARNQERLGWHLIRRCIKTANNRVKNADPAGIDNRSYLSPLAEYYHMVKIMSGQLEEFGKKLHEMYGFTKPSGDEYKMLMKTVDQLISKKKAGLVLKAEDLDRFMNSMENYLIHKDGELLTVDSNPTRLKGIGAQRYQEINRVWRSFYPLTQRAVKGGLEELDPRKAAALELEEIDDSNPRSADVIHRNREKCAAFIAGFGEDQEIVDEDTDLFVNLPGITGSKVFMSKEDAAQKIIEMRADHLHYEKYPVNHSLNQFYRELETSSAEGMQQLSRRGLEASEILEAYEEGELDPQASVPALKKALAIHFLGDKYQNGAFPMESTLKIRDLEHLEEDIARIASLIDDRMITNEFVKDFNRGNGMRTLDRSIMEKLSNQKKEEFKGGKEKKLPEKKQEKESRIINAPKK